MTHGSPSLPRRSHRCVFHSVHRRSLHNACSLAQHCSRRSLKCAIAAPTPQRILPRSRPHPLFLYNSLRALEFT
eukprot:391727-Rhodomonas_salina.5